MKFRSFGMSEEWKDFIHFVLHYIYLCSICFYLLVNEPIVAKVEDKGAWLLFLFILFYFSYAYIFIRSVFNNEKGGFYYQCERWMVIVMSIFVQLSIFACGYRAFGIINVNGEMVNDSISSLYFSIVTWTTLGYGDFRPSEGSRLIASVQALLGYLYMSFLIGVFFLSFKSKDVDDRTEHSSFLDFNFVIFASLGVIILFTILL